MSETLNIDEFLKAQESGSLDKIKDTKDMILKIERETEFKKTLAYKFTLSSLKKRLKKLEQEAA